MSPDWLTQLAPAHAPPAPGWWPPAPGWWALAGLSLALLALLGGWYWRPRQARQRLALRELARIRADGEADIAACARAIENVLRRYALAVFGRGEVARLSGAAWLSFAQRHGAAELADETGRSLLVAAFGGVVPEQPDARERWLAGAEGFVRRARAHGAPSAGSTSRAEAQAPMKQRHMRSGRP